MNKKQLIDAIGQLNDSVFAGTETIGAASETRFSAKTEARGGMRKGRKVFLLAAAAVLLIGGTALAAPLLRGGTLKNEKEKVDGKEYNTFRYETDEDTRVSVSDIKGSVLAAMDEIPGRVANASPTDSILPQTVMRRFNSVDEALSYIGYARMIFPRLNYSYESIHTEVLGTKPDGSDQYVPGHILLQTTQKYTGVSELHFTVGATIRTDALPADSSVIRVDMYPSQTAYSTEEVTVNGRTFTVVRQKNESFDPGWEMMTEVYWQENGVSYLMSVPYTEADAECAEQLVNEWMNSFPQH
ncbi:MAG: hypothetical protein J5648_05740 [Lachnospiraceae bacterium]|nr:hypothetical protein [Lachnospiraceae bacterium]